MVGCVNGGFHELGAFNQYFSIFPWNVIDKGSEELIWGVAVVDGQICRTSCWKAR